MEKLKLFIQNEKVAGVIAIVAAVVMYFTPDCVDRIIELCLAALGIKKLTLTAEDKKK